MSADRPVHTRRAILGAAAGVAAAALTVACRSPGGAESPNRRLRVMMNGGIYEEHARRLVVGPFEHDTGASVELVPGSAAQIITRLTAERAAPSVDVVIVDELVMGTAIDEGLFDTIDPRQVPSLGDLSPDALDKRGYGPRVHCHNLVLGYNTKQLGVEPPARWADLWDTRFKGLVAPGAVERRAGADLAGVRIEGLRKAFGRHVVVDIPELTTPAEMQTTPRR